MTYSNQPYPHEGIDFDGENIPATNKNKQSRTPIHSFINGKVVLKKDNGEENYGRHIIICDFEDKLYLLGHLYDYADGIDIGAIVTPGMTVGYVGNTGNCGAAEDKASGKGSHLHVSNFEFSDGFVKSLNLMTDSLDIQKKVIEKIGRGSSYNCYSNFAKKYKVVNPFDYSKERKI